MVKKRRKLLIAAICTIILLGIIITSIAVYRSHATYGFEVPISEAEKTLRMNLITAAESWLNCNETDGSHKQIIDLYNNHEPLAQGYRVQYSDQWCATFVSAAAIRSGLTEIIPTECGCQRQIRLFEQLGSWEEADDYKPLPGDIIYYSRNSSQLFGDCTQWSDHVGIVVGTNGNMIKVIEGNYDDAVGYRIIRVNDPIIRGFGIPNYSSLIE